MVVDLPHTLCRQSVQTT